MRFLIQNWYWFLSGIIIVGLTAWGIVYYTTGPNDEIEFIITPLDNSEPFPYDFSESDSDFLGDYVKEIQSIVPAPVTPAPSTPTPAPPPAETPWEQGPSDQEIVPVPTPPPPAETPWEQGPSDQ